MHLLHPFGFRHFAISRQPAEFLLDTQEKNEGRLTNLLVDLEEFCNTSVDAYTLSLVQVWLGVSWANAFIVT